MTLGQLGAFVFVARLGSVKAAARALGVSEPAVSQSLAQLRRHLGDPLLVRESDRMVLTEGGARLYGIASQMVALGAQAQRVVQSGGPERLHVVMDSSMYELVAGPLISLYSQRRIPVATSGVVQCAEVPLLLAGRLAEVALGPQSEGEGLLSRPVLRCRVVAVGALHGRRDTWLVDPSGTDPGSDAGRLLRLLRVPESRVRVYATQAAAWQAAAEGEGLAPAVAHLVLPHLRRGTLTVVETSVTPLEIRWYATTLPPSERSPAAGSFVDFLTTPSATQVMRAPQDGIPKERFRPAVHVSIWS
ncbi:MAG: LysR family transcriptional regulator [Thermoactinospora sp.]|nr:LysR family transcriptional regulator [Thermoactinospora sp.]